ncbi:mast cell protease 1A-like [Latimeria chalumnae]|uniref:Peptidase S1 domain-containing protein n=1 Tax=Latimeria chalumnae TaxID=7897 RepID=M3XLN8_LATCH|nr:PREDICTED: mast cell protease 1A-like [Latimeria chalumnae]|eukprot:XP_005991999.1 PREDICTED: mast cell protease 1A-like [Latimeria chalumnae]
MAVLHLATIFVLLATTQARVLRDGIIGGKEAKPHSRPYMAYLVEGTNWNEMKFLCGGFLVADQWVMTAAHCFDNVQQPNVTVLLGVHNIKLERGVKTFYIRRGVEHPRYFHKREHKIVNDIFLLKLNKKATLNSYVSTIALPEAESEVKVGTNCSVAGWGAISNDINNSASYPSSLQEVKTTIIDRNRCNSSWSGKIASTNICADGSGQVKGFCSGDSGGPLVCDNTAVGIVSFSGNPCGSFKLPDVYTQISKYSDWVKKYIRLFT